MRRHRVTASPSGVCKRNRQATLRVTSPPRPPGVDEALTMKRRVARLRGLAPGFATSCGVDAPGQESPSRDHVPAGSHDPAHMLDITRGPSRRFPDSCKPLIRRSTVEPLQHHDVGRSKPGTARARRGPHSTRPTRGALTRRPLRSASHSATAAHKTTALAWYICFNVYLRDANPSATRSRGPDRTRHLSLS